MMTYILVIADQPTEQETSAPFRGAASMLMRSSLRTACAKSGVTLTTKDLDFAYLSEERTIGGVDLEVLPKALITDHNRDSFVRLPHLVEEIYISPFLWRSWENLLSKIRRLQPKIIVASGKWSLFFLGCYPQNEQPIGRLSSVKASTKNSNTFGLNVKFRGSTLAAYKALDLPTATIILPIIPHQQQAAINAPTAIRVDYLRIAMLYANFKNNLTIPEDFLSFEPKVTVLDQFTEAKTFLKTTLDVLNNSEQPVKISVDLETVAKTIDTVGIALNQEEGFSIPLLKRYEYKVSKIEAKAYSAEGQPTKVALGSILSSFTPVFSLEEEAELVELFCIIFSHPKTQLIGHNFHYDCAVMAETWGLVVHPWRCTMTLASVLHNTRKKGLAFLCSIYNQNYVYWKDDLNAKDSRLRWEYCAKDALNTFILADNLEEELQALPERNKRYYLNKQERTAKHVLLRMLDGLTIDLAERKRIDDEFTKLYDITIKALQELVGYELNIYSTPQIRALFVDCLGIEAILDRKRKTATFGKTAMAKYISRYPEYGLLLALILEAKSIHTYLSTFIRASLDDDNLLRSFIGVSGTKSYRFSSKKWLWGVGANIMNWSSGDRTSLAHSLELLNSYEDDFSPEEEDNDDETVNSVLISIPEENVLKLSTPNSKRIVIPSSKEKFFINVDLSSGDLHFVAWMSGAKWVMDVLSSGGDVYTELAKIYYDDPTITKKDPRRQKFKMTCHALNYLGTPHTIAMQAELEEAEVLRIQDFYFTTNPEIVEHYQNKIINDCLTLGYVENFFGAKYECDTTDETKDKNWRQKMTALPAQGSVADHINEIMDRADEVELIRKEEKQFYLTSKLQCHDAGFWEGFLADKDWRDRIDYYFNLTLPFISPLGESTPLVIPWDVSYSSKSYAACK